MVKVKSSELKSLTIKLCLRRNKHSTINQVHRITDIIENALEAKKVCAAVFLDVAQAFDKSLA